MTLAGILNVFLISAQNVPANAETPEKLGLGFSAGPAVTYTDKAFLLSTQISGHLDYKISERCFIQLAPKYTWLIRWNEHYLTLPLHIGARFGERISCVAGPALTFDLGFFRDIGISAGVFYRFSERSAIGLSAHTFTLYDYSIDY